LGGDTIILDVDDNDIIPKALKVFPGSKQFNGQLLLSVKNAGRQIEEVLEKCKRNRITVIEANIRKPSLGDVFLHYTGREIRDENGSEKDAMRRRFMRGR
jgi:ABC-2 type transport system ATP-binding protein